MHYLSANFAYLGPGFALLLTLVGAIYGLFGWRIVRMLVLIDAIAIGAVIALGLQAPSARAVLPLSPVVAGAFVVSILPLAAFMQPHRAAIALFGVVGFLASMLILLDLPMGFEARLAVSVACAGLAVAFGMSVYQATTVFITGLHGGCMVAVAMAIIASYPGNPVGGLIQSSTSSFDYTLPAAGIAFSTILIAVQWADLQGNAASNAFPEDECES